MGASAATQAHRVPFDDAVVTSSGSMIHFSQMPARAHANEGYRNAAAS